MITFDIPAHWQIIKNKHLFRERVEYSSKGTEPLLSVSKHYGVKSLSALANDEQYATLKPSESLIGYKCAAKNDLVMNIMRARNGSYGISPLNGIVSPAYCVYQVIQPCNVLYLQYLLRTPLIMGLFEAYSTGIAEHRRRLYPDEFFKLYMPLPPREEQDQIVRFLDWKVSQINRLINAKKKQIVLIKEHKRIYINSAVTRGGADWTKTRLINLFSSVKSGAWGEEPHATGMNLACIRVADFDFEHLTIKDREYTIRSYPPSLVQKLKLRSNDILIEKSGGGDKQPVGRAVLYNKNIDALCANFIDAVRPIEDVSAQFLTYLLAAMYFRGINVFHYNQTTGIQNLDVDRYLRESAYIPRIPKQRVIAQQLDNHCAAIDKLVDKIDAEISLLLEYRTRLISDVVTGKIDVQDVVVPAFEEVEENSDIRNDDEEMEEENE